MQCMFEEDHKKKKVENDLSLGNEFKVLMFLRVQKFMKTSLDNEL